jgi:hypothetical protein
MVNAEGNEKEHWRKSGRPVRNGASCRGLLDAVHRDSCELRRKRINAL